MDDTLPPPTVDFADFQRRIAERSAALREEQRVEEARQALSAVTSVGEAAALVAAPSEDNARKLVEAIQGKDLSSEVGSMLPSEKDYE